MDDGGSPTAGLLIFAVFILVDFVIFGFIAAMENINESSVEKMAEEDDRRAKLLMRYMDKTDRYMHVCYFLIVIAHMLLGFLQVPLWKRYFLPGEVSPLSGVAVSVAVFFVLILLVLVFGIYTPGKVASRKPEGWALCLVRLIRALELTFSPVILFADALSNLLSRVFGVDPLSDTDDVTEEDIISMVNEGHEQGMLLASEAEMIHNIFEFGDKEAKDIMTHRKNIIALDGTKTFRQTLEVIKENNFSRFPVYIDDIDNIIGVLHIKEALDTSMESAVYDVPVKDIKGVIREVDFIPETRNINTLFTTMQMQKSHLVIVVDEYGQTSGIVAMEDILEEIVGNIEDEHDEEEQTIVMQSDGSYLMSGMADFEDVLEELDIQPDESEDFETLNGFLISLIGKIPGDDEVFKTAAHGYSFEILSVENKIIKTVRAQKLPKESAESKAHEKMPDDACQNEE